MSWSETHERYRIIKEVVQAAEADPSGELPWREEYAAVFSTPDVLVAALRQRWQRTCEAQLDQLSDEELQERHRQLMVEHAGVLRILDNFRYVPAKSASSLTTVA
jgi:hypothetical protein